MQWMLLIFGSGLAFFLGVGLVLAAVAASLGRRQVWVALSTILGSLGLIVVVLSGTPLPVWHYALASTLTVVWMVSARSKVWRIQRWQRGMAATVAVTWVVAALYEVQFQFMPSLSPASSRRLYLFGDSLAAGVNDDTAHNWPQLLATAHQLDLENYSRAGATTAIARRAARGVSFNDGVVLLEIGGNDMLGSTSVEQFERDLEALLKETCRPGVQVVMFELPIPPLHNGYGRVQRRLSAKYHVSLVPKQVLAAVIAGSGSTIDSLHLSAAGHLAMADAAWRVLNGAFDPPE
jgi:acyl-CoA thioesterase-1